MPAPSRGTSGAPLGRDAWHRSVLRTIALVAAVSAFIVLWEWLFQITKPSFLEVFRVHQRLAAAGVGAVLATVLPVLLTSVVYMVFSWAGRVRRLGVRVATVVPAILLSIVTLLAVENFTHTLFDVGLVTVGSVGRFVYLVALGIGFLFFWSKSYGYCLRPISKTDQVLGTLPAIGLLLGFWAWGTLPTQEMAPLRTDADSSRLPNIVLISPDGVDARFTQAYGHESPNTPFLTELLSESLRMRHAVASTRSTAGSSVSLLTGRYPLTTKVVDPPHKLAGIDAYRHLVGILRGLGYRSIQTSVRYYAGATDLNMKSSFDISNGVPTDEGLLSVPMAVMVAFPSAGLLLDDIRQKVDDRLAHLAGKRELFDVRSISDDSWVLSGSDRVSDPARIESVLDFFEEAHGQPVFAHIHLIETHCCRFRPRKRRFSARQPWHEVVADSDDRVRELVEGLQRLGEWDNTILVFSSDHTRRWGVDKYIPLVMRFPDRRSGDVEQLAQLIDVAPTLLDYLEVPVPGWMEGRSLLESRSAGELLAISTAEVKPAKGERRVPSGYPHFGVKALQVGRCNQWIRIHLETGQFERGQLGDRWPCEGRLRPNRALSRALEHLSERGFGKLENLEAALAEVSSPSGASLH